MSHENSVELGLLEKIIKINLARNERFGNDSPFQIIARLAEETGELAGAVNHTEHQGVKVAKHGEPSLQIIAEEVFDVVTAAISAAQHYDCIDQVVDFVEKTFQRYIEEGYIDLNR